MAMRPATKSLWKRPFSASERGGRRTHQERAAREVVEVTYYPVLKNQALGRRMTRLIPVVRGENPVKAAERALAECYKVRDYVIFDAHIAKSALRRSEGGYA